MLLLKGESKMLTKSTVAIISGIAVIGLLSGCASSSDQSSKKMSPSPTVTETETPAPSETDTPTPIETDNPEYKPVLDYTQDIVLAKNDLELEFLTIALASCERAQQDGFITSEPSGESIFRPDVTGMWPDWPFDQVSIIDGKPGFGEYDDIYRDYPPGLFYPCSLEAAARYPGIDPEDVALEHKVRKISDDYYVWAQHQYGANLEETGYKVQDGLITGIGKDKKVTVKISYGPLTEKQIALLDQAEN
jgi:hypothetical protein